MKHIIIIIFMSLSFNSIAQDNGDIQDNDETSTIEDKDNTQDKREKVITITFNKEAFKNNKKRRKEKIIAFYDRQIEKHLERKEKDQEISKDEEFEKK